MACFNSNRYSCFGPYYPCPISCCSCRCCNTVVQNPSVVTTNLAFFALTTTTTVDAEGIIPVSLITNFGTAITSPTVGTINLTPGTYEATYNVNSIIGVSGNNSFGLQLGGTTIPASVMIVTGTEGNGIAASNSVVFTVATNAAALTLNNLDADAVDVNMANLTIRKIS